MLRVKAKWNLALPIVLMLVFAVTRWPGWLPEGFQNFSAAYALAFCAGVYLPGSLAWWLPLGTLLTTDILLYVFYYHASVFNVYILGNYAVYVLLIWFGRAQSARASWLRLVCGTVFGALLFYLVTNTIAWLQNPEYPKTLAGWIQALTIGIPGFPPTWTFFRNSLLSGGLFAGLFAGAAKLGEAAESAREKEAPEAEEDEAPEPPGETQPEDAKG